MDKYTKLNMVKYRMDNYSKLFMGKPETTMESQFIMATTTTTAVEHSKHMGLPQMDSLPT